MRCFNHPDNEAIGGCKVCNKGLCRECAADLGHSLACRNSHEEKAEDLERLTARAMQVQSTAGGAKYVAPAFMVFMGAIFTGYGLFWERGAHLLMIMGIGFLVYGVFLFRVNRRAFARKLGDI
jgi:hypothetical protein